MPANETDTSAEDLLRPYLSALLSSDVSTGPIAPLFHMFYYERLNLTTTSKTPSPSLIVSPNIVSSVTEVGDEVAQHAEALFHEAISKLKNSPGVLARHSEDAEMLFDIESLWPPQQSSEEEEGGDSMDDW
jgi:hypothetical protein